MQAVVFLFLVEIWKIELLQLVLEGLTESILNFENQKRAGDSSWT